MVASPFYEYPMHKWFDTALNNTFIDIGANIGYYTILCLNNLKYRQAICFEPNPQTLLLLKKTFF